MRTARLLLTQEFVNTVIPVRRTYKNDHEIRGLALDLAPPRTLTYVFRYRERGRQKSVRIGSARVVCRSLIAGRACRATIGSVRHHLTTSRTRSMGEVTASER